MIYIASSWKNPVQMAVVAACRSAGLDCYDFRHPAPGNDGFSWKQVMPGLRYDGHGFGGTVSQQEYLDGIADPIAEEGFKLDFEAMEQADTCVLVLPCGRSSHLELGWFIGQGKRTAILLDDPVTPELMYKMVDFIAPSLFDLLGWLGVED